MNDLTPDQREMLSLIHLRDWCDGARRQWSIHKVDRYVVQVAGPGENVSGVGDTLQAAVFAAIGAVESEP